MARKYARDNRGRFASKGAGATARGGRLKTAGGNKRETQTMQAAGGRAGTIGKPRGLKPQRLSMGDQAKAGLPNRHRTNLSGESFERRAKKARGLAITRAINESDREAGLRSGPGRERPERRFASSNARTARSDRTASAARAFYASYGSPGMFGRREVKRTSQSPAFASKKKGRR